MKNGYGKRQPKLTPIKANKSIRIGERDIELLHSLAKYRFLTADQLLKLHFPAGSTSYCNERLKLLFHKPNRLVDRHPLPIEWGKGSPKLAYTLTKKGAVFLKANGKYSALTSQQAYKRKQITHHYRKHEIAINEVRIAVELSAKKQGIEVYEWISDTDFKNPEVLAKTKVYDPTTSSYIPIAPDGFFALYFPQSNKYSVFFLELDRGTMEQPRFRFKKIRGYHLFGEKWREVELFRKYKDLPTTFRVLTVVDGGTERANNLKTFCAEKEFTDDEYEERIAKSRRFYFTELSRITPENILSTPIWLLPFQSRTPEERFALFDKLS